MAERIHAGLRHLGIVRLVPRRIEQAGRLDLAEIAWKLEARERPAMEVDPPRAGGDIERLDRGPRYLRILADHRAELRVRGLEQRLTQANVLQSRLVELVLQERHVQARFSDARRAVF